MGKRPAQKLINASLMQEWPKRRPHVGPRSTELSTQFVDKKKYRANPVT
jgi:hypothetical protein